MAYSIVTKDGIRIDNIPDGIAQDDQRLKDEVARLRASGQKSSMFQAQPVEQQVEQPVKNPQEVVTQVNPTQVQPEQPGAVKEFMQGAAQGLGEGAASTIRGLAGGAASTVGLVSDPITALINLALPEEYRGKPAAEAVQELLTRLGVPESKTAAQKIVQAGAAGLSGGGGSVMTGKALAKGAALAPSVIQGVGKAMAAQPIQQLTGGLGAGLASQGAAEAGAPVPVQLAAGLAGGVAGSALGGARISSPKTSGVQEAKDAGIDLMTSDVRQPKTFAGRWGQSFAEKIPGVGTGGMRKAQQAQRVDAVRDLVRQYGAEDIAAASDDVMSDLLGKRSGDITKWSTLKNEVIDKLSEPKNISAFNESVSKTSISPIVPMTKTVQKIDDSIASLKSLKTEQMTPVINILDDWKQAVQGQDLKNVELLRKQIGEAFKAPELASVRSTGERVLSDIYGSVKDDMTDYISKAGGTADLNKWQAANKQLANMMNELELPALKSAIERGETTPETINKLLFSNKRSDVDALFRNLSPDGKASARAAIIARAAENKSGDLSPDRFASEVKKMGAQIGVFFSDDDAKQVNGLVRALDATKRASQAALNPATGVQTVLPVSYTAMAALIPGSPMERFLGATAGMALAGGAARLYESKPVRDILMKLPMVKPGGPEEAALLKRLIEATQAKANATKKEAR
jgi:hypothetical protein